MSAPHTAVRRVIVLYGTERDSLPLAAHEAVIEVFNSLSEAVRVALPQGGAAEGVVPPRPGGTVAVAIAATRARGVEIARDARQRGFETAARPYGVFMRELVRVGSVDLAVERTYNEHARALA